MWRLAIATCLALTACGHGLHIAATNEPHWEPMPDLPLPRTNNAVALAEHEDARVVVSALGLSRGKQWSDVESDAWQLDLQAGIWTELAPVPGPGRLASSAVALFHRVFLIGGYTVAEDGTEVSVPGIDVWSAKTGQWSTGPTMPTPVDDAVAGLWRDRWIVLVSGWSDDTSVRDVQLLDIEHGRWISGTPILGEPVFGHAGAVLDDSLVYCGGVRVVANAEQKFQPNAGCYLGTLSVPAGTIAWSELPSHPGEARYRMASGAVRGRIVFAGGTDNPYNYDGIGYDGRPSEPVADVFAWNVRDGAWETLPDLPEPSMDHRGLVPVDGDLLLVGGMDGDRMPTTRVWRLVL